MTTTSINEHIQIQPTERQWDGEGRWDIIVGGEWFATCVDRYVASELRDMIAAGYRIGLLGLTNL